MKPTKIERISIEVLDSGYILDMWGKALNNDNGRLEFYTYKRVFERKVDLKEELKDLLKDF